MVLIQIDLTQEQNKAMNILKAINDLETKEAAIKLLIDRHMSKRQK